MVCRLVVVSCRGDVGGTRSTPFHRHKHAQTGSNRNGIDSGGGRCVVLGCTWGHYNAAAGPWSLLGYCRSLISTLVIDLAVRATPKLPLPWIWLIDR